MNNTLIGAGGHASVVKEIASQQGVKFNHYADPSVKNFEDLTQIDEFGSFSHFFMGMGGVTPAQLAKRMELFDAYIDKGYQSHRIISPTSYVSKEAGLAQGCLVAHHAVVQTGAHIGVNVIINTSAIVEHGVTVGQGSHIAPGAMILGDATIGQCCMIGAGAVVLPGSIVPDNYLVSSLTRYNNDQ